MVILIRKNLFIVGLLLLLLTSCKLDAFLEKQESHSEWVTKWLTNPTCQPPCWENIIPGQTKIDDVATVLAATQGIYDLTNPVKDPLSEGRQIDWRFDKSRDSGGAQTDEQGSVVFELFFNTYQPITTEEVFMKYGDPTNVLLYDCRSEIGRKTCIVHLVYKNKGMILDLFLNDIGRNGYQIKVEPDSRISSIYFFPASENNYEEIYGINSPNYPKFYYSWNGYSIYP